MMQESIKEVQINLGRNNQLEVVPSQLRVSGGETVKFIFNTAARVNLNPALANLEEIDAEPGSEHTITILEQANRNQPAGGFSYQVSAVPSGGMLQATTEPKMIIE